MIRDEFECFWLKCDLFFFCYLGEVLGDRGVGGWPKMKALCSTDDGCRYFMYLCRCKNKYDVFWRLLERFEERVKAFAGEHMDFIDDVDFVFCTHWCDMDFFTEVADVVDAAIARRVYLDDVEVWIFGILKAIDHMSNDTGN